MQKPLFHTSFLYLQYNSNQMLDVRASPLFTSLYVMNLDVCVASKWADLTFNVG